MALCGAFASGGVNADLPRLIALAALAALLLQAATSTLQQLSDVDIDRINDPRLPICSGEITALRASVFGWGAASLALLVVLVLSAVTRQWLSLPLLAVFALARCARSIRGIHLQSRAWPLSALLAIVEGTCLAAAGWALTGPLTVPHVWPLALIAGLLFAGTGMVREIAGQRGDAAYGVATLATSVGPAKAAKFAAPMLVLPFLLLPVAAATGLIRVPPGQLLDTIAVGAGCALLGARLAAILVADPDAQQPGNSLVPRLAMLSALYFVAGAITHIPYAQWGRWIRELT